jgi:hypothetical protein
VSCSIEKRGEGHRKVALLKPFFCSSFSGEGQLHLSGVRKSRDIDGPMIRLVSQGKALNGFPVDVKRCCAFFEPRCDEMATIRLTRMNSLHS